MGGKCYVPALDDMTPCTGVVEYVDQFARRRTVDFLGAPFGLDAREVREMAVSYEETTPSGVLELRVMHPVHMLESRASNVSCLPGYRTSHGMKQLRASVECTREFLRDLLEDGRTRDVLRLNERIFSFALRDAGLDVWVREGVSVFDAMLRDSQLPEAFERIRFPQMQREIEDRRAAAAERAYRSGEGGIYVFAGDELRGNRLVAKLRGANGNVRELDGDRPGSVMVRVGDAVRCRDGALEVVAQDLEREWSRGR